MRARLIITLVLALLVASCGDDDGLTTSSTTGASTTTQGVSTTTGEASTTTEGVTTTGPAGELAWERIPDDEAVFGPAEGGTRAEMWAVAAGGPGLVAVGDDDSGGDVDAAAWTSPDGVAWSRVPHDEAVFGGVGAQQMAEVVAGGPGLVAVGGDYPGFGDSDAAVWTSPDGLIWTRVPHDEAIFGGEGYQEMWGVAVGGPGLVGVGHGDNGEDVDAAVWTSPDGLAWTPVPADPAVFGGPSEQAMVRVVAGGPGLVAVGWDYSGGDEDAAVWTSPDGFTWTRVPHDEAVFGGPTGQEIRALGVGGPGLVAVGNDMSGGDLDAAVWTSPDGLTWTRVPHDEGTLGGPDAQEIWGVVAGGPGLVAVGHDHEGDEWKAAVWTSPDGVTWARVPHAEAVFGGPDDQWMAAVTVGGPGLVAVGQDGMATDLNAAVWVNRPIG